MPTMLQQMLKQLKAFRSKHALLTTTLLGALAALGFAPLFLWPITVICLALFLRDAMTQPHHHTKAFLKRCFCFYFGFSVAALWWVGGSFRYTDAGPIGLAAAPFAVLGIAFAMSLFVLPALYAEWKLWPKTPLLLKPLLVTLAWVGVEVLRSLTVYGFPWHLVGYTLANDTAILQAAAFGGVWLLSSLIILPAAAYAAKPTARFTVFWLTPLLAAFAFGAVTLAKNPAQIADTQPAVRLVQTNTPQGEKWQMMGIVTARKVLQALENNPTPNTLTVFPEVAITMLLNDIPDFGPLVGDLLGQGSVAAIGIPRFVDDTYLNSIVTVNSDGKIIDSFDKQLLVPFGEFVPLRQFMPSFVKKLAQGGDYKGGHSPRVLDVGPFGKALPIICYESGFPYDITKAAKAHKTNLILNLTNDAWFDGTTGGAQHFAIARVRSVETGLPQMRVANTGITAVIDSFGRPLKRSKLRHMYQIDHLIPKHHQTFFLRNLP